MNIAVIFAGGTGKRMNTKDRPKQFLMVHGKPIIIHTIEIFQYHTEIDGIVVACVSDWIPYMEEMKERYRLDKISKIVESVSMKRLLLRIQKITFGPRIIPVLRNSGELSKLFLRTFWIDCSLKKRIKTTTNASFSCKSLF